MNRHRPDEYNISILIPQKTHSTKQWDRTEIIISNFSEYLVNQTFATYCNNLQEFINDKNNNVPLSRKREAIVTHERTSDRAHPLSTQPSKPQKSPTTAPFLNPSNLITRIKNAPQSHAARARRKTSHGRAQDSVTRAARPTKSRKAPERFLAMKSSRRRHQRTDRGGARLCGSRSRLPPPRAKETQRA